MDRIVQGCFLHIEGVSYQVLARTVYVTAEAPQSRYTKIFLADHHVLVVPSEGEDLYFGQDRGNLGDDLMTRETFDYEGVTYYRKVSDYQIVAEAVFGDPLQTEGEVRFVDFADAGEELFISLGLVMRTAKRADVAARLLARRDVRVEETGAKK